MDLKLKGSRPQYHLDDLHGPLVDAHDVREESPGLTNSIHRYTWATSDRAGNGDYSSTLAPSNGKGCCLGRACEPTEQTGDPQPLSTSSSIISPGQTWEEDNPTSLLSLVLTSF